MDFIDQATEVLIRGAPVSVGNNFRLRSSGEFHL